MKTREEWLMAVSEKIWLLIIENGGNRPDRIRISVGFPKARRGVRAHAIGQCWPSQLSADETHEIFVSPELGTFPAVETLVHELVHASVGLEHGHKAPFKKMALAVGLEGKMTATHAGDRLTMLINDWLLQLPPYPHAVLSDIGKGKGPGSRLIKATCEGCEYTVRVTAKWLKIGSPLCPNDACDYFRYPMQHESIDEEESEGEEE